MEENKEVDYSYVTFYRDKTGEVLRYKFGRCLNDCISDFKVYLDENKNLIQLYKNNKRIFLEIYLMKILGNVKFISIF